MRLANSNAAKVSPGTKNNPALRLVSNLSASATTLHGHIQAIHGDVRAGHTRITAGHSHETAGHSRVTAGHSHATAGHTVMQKPETARHSRATPERWPFRPQLKVILPLLPLKSVDHGFPN